MNTCMQGTAGKRRLRTSGRICLGLVCLLLLGSAMYEPQKGKELRLAYKAEATTGEGSIWHPGRKSLFWVDIEGKTLYEYLPGKQTCLSWTFDRMVSTVVPETKTTVLVSLQDEILRLDLDSGKKSHVAAIDDKQGTLRCNDGKCDPMGRLWVGTMCLKAPKSSASLLCVMNDGKVVSKISGVTISNGLVWNADKTKMYYIDTPTGEIVRYSYDAPTGNIVYDKVVVKVPAGCGAPDGMTIDANGNLWVAHWGGYGVYCWNPETGVLLDKIDVPAPNVASCAFGGPKLDVLYITTARAGLSDADLQKYPLSGSLFSVVPGVRGVKANVAKITPGE